MGSYQVILEELRLRTPEEVISYPPPYNENANLNKKFESLTNAVERARRFGDRLLLLTNAYYLGQFLETNLETKTLRSVYAQKLSTYYRTVAIRTYYIFEWLGVDQIMRTRRMSLTTVRELSHQEYLDLVTKALEIFNGV